MDGFPAIMRCQMMSVLQDITLLMFTAMSHRVLCRYWCYAVAIVSLTNRTEVLKVSGRR